MHDVTSEHWHEPEGRKNAGYGVWKRPNTPYDDFMEAQGIPIFRGIGVRRVQDLPLKRWNRMGGNGTFIQLYGTEGKWGCYVVEVPGAGALNPEVLQYEPRGMLRIWNWYLYTYVTAAGSMLVAAAWWTAWRANRAARQRPRKKVVAGRA